mmetsp:Transcript_18628/g.38999  ORF Transcript_18628/g.38999 Transcript_18628/m.38999 type:complete len:355 (+) Transcript_18628:343-1407(+)
MCQSLVDTGRFQTEEEEEKEKEKEEEIRIRCLERNSHPKSRRSHARRGQLHGLLCRPRPNGTALHPRDQPLPRRRRPRRRHQHAPPALPPRRNSRTPARIERSPNLLRRAAPIRTPPNQPLRQAPSRLRGPPTGPPPRPILHQAGHQARRHVRTPRGDESQARRRPRIGPRHRISHRLQSQSRGGALHAQRRGRDRALLRRRHEGRFRDADRGTHHRLRVDGVLQSQVRSAAGGGEGGDQRGDQGRGDRRPAVRRGGGRAGGHGELRGGVGREDLSRQVHTQSQRSLHRTLPNPRRKIRPHRQVRRRHQNGGERDLRHRNLRLHRPRLHRGGHGVLPLHEELPRSPRPPSTPAF